MLIFGKEVEKLNLGDRVKQRRKELRMTQEELAAKMGYSSRSSINKVECGREVSQRIIVRLADALDVTVPYLMGWDETPVAKAEFEASVLLDEDIMEMVHLYMPLDAEKRKAVKQMAKLLHNS